MMGRLLNGKHKGRLFSEVPTDYVKWMVEFNHTQAAQAKEELGRRKALALDGRWKEPRP